MDGKKFDLLASYGVERIALYTYFHGTKRSTDFLKDYAYNEGKSIRLYSFEGNQKRWVCDCEGCPWFVQLSKKRPAKDPSRGKVTKLSHIPANAWYISKLHIVHDDLCSSVHKCSARQLQALSAFKGSIVQGLDTSLSRVVASLQASSGVNVRAQPATVYRAIAAEKRALEAAAAEINSYATLPSFLASFQQLNPGSRVCCQLDSKGRFYRVFVAVDSVARHQDKWLPVLESDGTHMHNPADNGVCLTLLGKDGDGHNVLAAIAFVHMETRDNFAWFYADCVASGIDLEHKALFTDRGKQLEAQTLLATLGIQVNIKFCSLHIEFNTIDRFKSVDPDITAVGPYIYSLQVSPTLYRFDATLAEIREAFPTPIHAGTDKEEYVSDYLAAMHPVSWARFANLGMPEAEIQLISTRWQAVNAYGRAVPMYGTRTTSANEGENNALNWSSLRSLDVPAAIVAFLERTIDTIHRGRERSHRWASK